MAGFTLSSDQFHGQVPLENVYHDFGAGGGNKSPHLSWHHPPEGTKSYLITCYDADAPGPGWWHWCAFNIPAGTTSLPTGASGQLPTGSVEVTNSYGSPGYGGACPPPGDTAHAYHIVVHALDTDRLELDETASPAMVMFMADAHIIGKAGVTAYYAR